LTLNIRLSLKLFTSLLRLKRDVEGLSNTVYFIFMKSVSRIALRYLLFVLSYFAIVAEISAVGAYPFPQTITQPDGTVLTVRLHGDEWFNWISTIDGYRIIKNADGVYEYVSLLKSGEVSPEGIKASDPENRSNAERAFLTSIQPGSGVSRETIQKIRESYSMQLKSSTSSVNFAPSGQQKLLVILANFSDRQPSYTQESFNRFMNEENYNGTGSFRDFYLENSGGRLEINSTVTQWVTLPNTHDYYGAENKWGEFAYHAVQAAHAAGVDFSQFDNDGNGIVESIAIIHQGPGQEVSRNDNDIWSHSWSLSAAGYSTNARRFNGVLVNQYTAQPETRDNFGAMNTIGVICHEFGHSLGIPDYYDTNQEIDGSYVGTGVWDLMASGTYNGSPQGSLPSHHNPFSKIELGWAQANTISDAGLQVLEPVISSENVLRINSPVTHEYILLENRRRQGFDAGLPGQGMLVYHVDANRIAQRRISNTINTSAHQGLYVKAAGGNINLPSAPYPGSLNITQLTDETNPAMVTWTDEPFNRSITNVTTINSAIHFNFMAVQNGSPLTFAAQTMGTTDIKLFWTPSLARNPVLLAWSPDNIFGEPVAGAEYSAGSTISGGGNVLYYGDTDTLFVHSGLEASTTYYYKVWSRLENEWSAPMSRQGITDVESITVFPWQDGFENDITNWRQTYLSGNYNWEIVTEGISANPKNAFEGNYFASFFVPSFTLGLTRLISPTLDLNPEHTYILEFRHFQVPWDNDQDKLKVLINSLGTDIWTELTFYEEREDQWIHRRIALPASSGSVKIAFEGYGQYGYGVGIDDIRVYQGTVCQTSGVSNVISNETSLSGMSLSWDLQEGESVLIVAKKKAKITNLPIQGTAYSVNDNFGDGSRVLYSGNGTSLNISNFDHSSNYHFAFFAYNEGFCYGIEPQYYIFSTETKIYNISFNVKHNETPVSNATVTLYNDSFITGSDGIFIAAIPHSEEYSYYKISVEGYKDVWKRLLPDSDQLIQIKLQSHNPKSPKALFNSKEGKNIELFWNPVIDESFDGYQAFSLILPGWTMIDNDNSRTYSLSDHNFINQGYIGSFIVIDPLYKGLIQSDFDLQAWSGRHFLAAFASIDKPNDDWLISPNFFVEEGDRFSFMARSLTSQYGLEQIRVYVGEQKSASTEYTLISSGTIDVPVAWTRFDNSLDAYAGKTISVAIQCVSNDALALFLDDIQIYNGSAPASSLVSPKAAITQSIKRATASDYEIQKQTAIQNAEPILKSLPASHTIGYTIEINNMEVGSVTGFHQNNFTLDLVSCKNNTFRIRTDYLHYNAVNAWSDIMTLDACYNVTFKVKNHQGLYLENAMIDFDQSILFTNNQGLSVFHGIDNPGQMIYTIAANEYEPVQNSLLVDDDVEIEIVLMPEDPNLVRLNSANVRLFPNPFSNNSFNIFGVSPGPVHIRIFDVSGRLVYTASREGGHQITLEIKNAHSGIYIVELSREKEIMYQKIFKQ
jgi:M6 family metalloprotease-like protein